MNLWMSILLVGTILVTRRIDEISILGLILVIPLIIMVIPTTISCGNYNNMPSDFESNIKEFITSQKAFQCFD